MALPQPDLSSPPAIRAPARIAAREWRWLALVTGLLLLLTVPPLLIAAARVPPGSIFPGYVVIARDAYVYQALWHAGAAGDWLFSSHYTAEPLPAVLLYPWYLWSGHLLGGLPSAWLYHGARVVAGAALGISVYLLAAELYRPVILRRWAFALASLGGGVGILVPSIPAGPLKIQATEMLSPGSSVADLIAMAPHLPLAMALMCTVLIAGLRMRRDPSWQLFVAGLAAVLGLQLIYPQLALLAGLVLVLWAGGRRLRRGLAFGAASLLIQAPYDLYLLQVMRQQPLALAAVRSSLVVGDPLGFLVLSHLVACFLIVVALITRRLRGDLILPGIWILGMTAFMFTPGISSTLGRVFMASSIPFGLCAVPGLLSLARRLRTRAWQRRMTSATIAIAAFYGVFSLAQPFWIAAFRLDPRAEYENRGEAVLLERLSPHVSFRDLVLTTYLEGLFTPAQTSARAYAGHPDMTIDAARKATDALSFFKSWTPEHRDKFLHDTGIDFVLTTDPLSAARLESDPLLRLVDREADASLFEVRR